jgi:hypothetical protein
MPGIANWDISAMKRVYVGENRSLEFRWETFNTFNHTQWSSVNTYSKDRQIFCRVDRHGFRSDRESHFDHRLSSLSRRTGFRLDANFHPPFRSGWR